MIASSHGAAIRALAIGNADIAIVKNRVWASMKRQYPNLELVGKDRGQNPNETLMVSVCNKNRKLVQKLTRALLSVHNDKSKEAMALKKSMDIRGFIRTSKADFKHTLNLLKRAGITKSFNFAF